MDVKVQNKIPILNVAWTRYAQLDSGSSARARPHYLLRRWIAILGVLATLFVILTQLYPENGSEIVAVLLKILLVGAPILASGLAVFTNKFHGRGEHLVMRAGAEEIKKEIFIFRTILANIPNRRTWLEKRLTTIQRQVFRGLGGELVLDRYTGQLPPYYDSKNPESDPGFHDLTGNEYFIYRVQDQLAWHIKKVKRYQRIRMRLQTFIILSGVASAILAALGGGFTLWVAFTASLSAAFIGWQELRNLDSVVQNFSKVVMELMFIYDHWNSLEQEERTPVEFFRMVKLTEHILWNQNIAYIKSIQDALADSELEEADLVDQVLKQSVEADAKFKKYLQHSVVDFTQEAITETYQIPMGSLAEEASSDIVQAELKAMKEGAKKVIESKIQRPSKLRGSLDEIAEEFADVDVSGDTPSDVLNKIISRFPKTNDMKG